MSKKPKIYLNYDAPLGARIKSGKGFIGVCIFNKDPGEIWWYIHSTREWVLSGDEKLKGKDYGSHAGCRSVRAFKRMLRKNPHIIGKAVLCNRYYQTDKDGNFKHEYNVNSVLTKEEEN